MQVLRHNAMKGRARKPPMKAKNMMALALELLSQPQYQVEGLTSMVREPYTIAASRGPRAGYENRGPGPNQGEASRTQYGARGQPSTSRPAGPSRNSTDRRSSLQVGRGATVKLRLLKP